MKEIIYGTAMVKKMPAEAGIFSCLNPMMMAG